MADDAPSELLSRRHQMFPVLTDAEMARMQRFGTRQTHPGGTRLVSAGEGLDTTLDIRIYRERPGTRKAKGSVDAFWNDLEHHLATHAK